VALKGPRTKARGTRVEEADGLIRSQVKTTKITSQIVAAIIAMLQVMRLVVDSKLLRLTNLLGTLSKMDTKVYRLKLINRINGTTTDGNNVRMKTRTKNQLINNRILRANGRITTKKKTTRRTSRTNSLTIVSTQIPPQTTRRKHKSKTKTLIGLMRKPSRHLLQK
jgi:hypothetical protein